MMKKLLLVAAGLLFIQLLFADIPTGYYNNAIGNGYVLKTQLYNIIKGHTSVSYNPSVWDAIYTTDVKPNGYVWDMYSDKPGGSPAYDYTLGDDQCGNYSGEGSCYNREHSFPKSWFDDASPMYTELFHVYPTDGYVNGKRSNFPFGEVGSASWTSTNGSKLGTSNYPGYSGTVFEPIDEYKGDFARTYFYMATRYENVISSWPGSAMLDGTNEQCYSDWALAMLIEWHENDPVSQKEIDRNDAVYAIQHNRNPFIDHPEYVNKIWGDGGNILPTISNIVITPTEPSATDIVGVSAIITDSDGSVSSAELHWGLSSGALSNNIAMSISSGDTFVTNSEIPVQEGGAVVYYEIKATDNNSEYAISSEYSYEVSTSIGIDYLSDNFISIYPNPTTGKVNFELKNTNKINALSIFNITGEKIIQINQLNNINYTIDLSNYPKGIYLVCVGNNEFNSVRKIILK